MKTSVEVLSQVKKKLVVEVEAEEVERKVNEAYKEIGKKAKVPGFRPGKVPRKILEKHFGSQVMEDVTRGLVTETLQSAVEETKAFPIAYPVIENEALKIGEGFRYSAIIEVKPEFDLKDYMGLEVEREICSLTDEDVKMRLEEIRKAKGRLNPLPSDRAIGEGDYAVLDYEGFEGERPVEGARYQDFLLNVGSGEFHPDFERALVGRRKGDELEITADFDDGHFHSKLAGKKVRFKVRIKDVKGMELPELNDDFARSIGGEFEDLESLRKKLKEQMVGGEEKRIDRDVKKRLLKKISGQVDFQLPDSLVESELDRAVQNVKQNISRMGSNLEKAGINEAKLREGLRPAAGKRVKDLLILGEIARQCDLQVTEMDVSGGLKEMAQGMGQDPEDLRRFYEANHLIGPLKERLLEEKTLNYLVSGAKIIKVEATRLTKDDEE